jgi:uncharacterized OsmC-like protein
LLRFGTWQEERDGTRDCGRSAFTSTRKRRRSFFKTRVESNITIEGDLTEEQHAYLIKEADNCYVTRMVRGDWDLAESNTSALAIV